MSASSNPPAPAGKPAPVPLVRARLPRWASLLIGGSAVWLVALFIVAVVAVVAETNEQRRNIEVAAARKILPAVPAPRDIAPDMPVAAANLPVAPKAVALDFIDQGKAAPKDANADQVALPCEKLGTRIVFHKNPVEAFKLAKQENKLVYMMHLSGHFEDVAFT